MTFERECNNIEMNEIIIENTHKRKISLINFSTLVNEELRINWQLIHLALLSSDFRPPFPKQFSL